MAGFQKVIVCGNLGRDPEMRSLSSGDRLATISIATSEQWRDKQSGERKEKTEWHRITIWGRAAEVVEKYVRKGDQLLVEGKLETRKWTDQQGQERYSTEIKVTDFGGSVALIGGNRRDGASNGSGRLADRGRDDNGGYGYDDAGNNGSSARSANVTQMAAGGRARNRNDDLDDEIPFVTNDLFSDPAFAKHRAIA